MKKDLKSIADQVGEVVLGLGGVHSVLADSLKQVASINIRKQMVLPMEGTMAEFERALFADKDHFRFVKVVLTTNSIAPWSVAADYGSQLLAFIDMVNDVRGTDDFKEYLSSFVDSGRNLVMSWVDRKSPKDLAFTLFLDPKDAVLPVAFSEGTSMSLVNQLVYILSVERIRSNATSYRFENGQLIVDYVI